MNKEKKYRDKEAIDMYELGYRQGLADAISANGDMLDAIRDVCGRRLELKLKELRKVFQEKKYE